MVDPSGRGRRRLSGLAGYAAFDKRLEKQIQGVRFRIPRLCFGGSATVRVDGTPLPRTIALSKMATTLESIEWAVEQATRSPSNCRLRNSDARRIMFLLADRIGPMRRQRLASWAGITERRARGILGAPPTPSEEAALASAILLLSARHRFERVEFPKTGNYPAVA